MSDQSSNRPLTSKPIVGSSGGTGMLKFAILVSLAAPCPSWALSLSHLPSRRMQSTRFADTHWIAVVYRSRTWACSRIPANTQARPASWQAGGLGFCKQALSRPKTVLGPGDLAQIHTSRSSTSRNSEAIRMAYVPSHLLDPAAKRGD